MKNYTRYLFPVLLAVTSIGLLRGQSASTYSFSEGTETYAQITGTTSTAIGDDGSENGIAIGFTFNFGGVDYTTFSINTNGFIRLGSNIAGSPWINSLGNTAIQRPLIAPFWDDNHLSTGTIRYAVTGSAPNRILTVDWNNFKVGGGGSTAGPSVSMLLRLYETTNGIEMVYGSPFTTTNAVTASVGINDMTSFLSVTPAATSTVSSSTANNSINATVMANLAGRKLTFVPPPPPACPLPTTLATTLTCPNVINFTWMDGGSSQDFDVYYATSNTPPDGSTTPTAAGLAGTSYVTPPLSDGTTYFFWVRANCTSESSGWAGPASRATPTTIATPVDISFDVIPTWTTTGANWSIGNNHGNPDPAAFVNLWSSTPNTTLTTNVYSGTQAGYTLEFDYRMLNWVSSGYPGSSSATPQAHGNLALDISTDCGATFTEIEASVPFMGTFTRYIYDLSAFAGQNIQVRFRGTRIAPGDFFIDLDNFFIGGVSCDVAVATPNVTQPTCSTPTGSIEVNATGTGTLEYSVDNGANWQVSNTFSNLTPNDYNIRVRQQADPTCDVAYANNPVALNPPTGCCTPPDIDDVDITNPDCIVMTGTIVVTATGSGTLVYSVDDGANYQVSNTFTGLIPGNYDVRVALQSDLSCNTTWLFNSVEIDPAPSPPTVLAPTVMQPTCAVASGTIVVNVLELTIMDFSIDDGVTWQLSDTFSGLVPGNYYIRVRDNEQPTCVTAYSGNPVMINPAPAAPTVNAPSVTQPTCAVPTGTIVVNATGSGLLEYSVDDGANWQASSTFSGLTPGNYNIRVRLQADPTCETAYASNPVDIIAVTGCCPNASQVFINEFHYDNVGGDVDEFVEVAVANSWGGNASDVTLTLYNGANGLSYGTHGLATFTVGTNDGTYTYYHKFIAGIQNGDPDGFSLSCGGVAYEFISYGGTFMAANGPANGQTSVDVIAKQSNTTPIGSSIQKIGTLWYQTCGQNTKGSPNALPSIAITATDADKQEGNASNTAFTFTVTRSGLTSGATIVNYAVTGSGANPANAADFGGVLPSGMVSFDANEISKVLTIQVSGDTDVEPDEEFTVTLTNVTSCHTDITSATAIGIIRNDDVACTPPSITMVDVTQPTCAVPTGTIVVTATGGGTLVYSVDNGSNYQVSNTFSGLVPNSYNIRVALQADPTCNTTYAGNPIGINPAPTAPTVNDPTVTQPTCATPSGTIVVNAIGSGLEYSVDNGATWQLSSTFSGLTPGDYNIRVRLQADITCNTPYAGNPVSINNVPVAPTVDVPTVTQPTCAVPTGTIVINATGTGPLEYSIDGGQTWQSSNTFSGLLPSSNQIVVRLQGEATCNTTYAGNPIGINPAPTAPTVNAPAVTQPTCATPSGTIVVNATGSGLEYSVDNGANWQLSNTFSGLNPGNYNIRVRLQGDATCNTAFAGNPVIIQPVPFPPSFSACPSGLMANTASGVCSAVVSYTVAATGVPAPAMTYIFTGATVGNGNGTGSGAVYNLGVTNVEVTATNDCGSVTCVFTVTVSDGESPAVVCKSHTAFLDANGQAAIVPADVFAGGSDNCGTVNMVSVLPNSFGCGDIGPNTVTLTVNDGNGNQSQCSATVTVVDNLPPSVQCMNASVPLDANGEATITPATIFAGSGDNCGFIGIVSLVPSAFNCSNVGPNLVTLTVTDGNGNNNSCTAIVTIEDNLPPTAVCKNITVNLNVIGTATISPAMVNDGSSDNCGFSLSLDNNSFTCANIGPNTVTLTATDPSMNSHSCQATVNVVDNLPPIALCKSATVFLDANGNGSLMASQVNNGSTDNCGIANMGVLPNMFTCNNLGANTMTLMVNDWNGNSSSCQATVTVVDNLPPLVACQNLTVQIDGTGNAYIVPADVHDAANSSDNCGNVILVSVVPNQFDCGEIGDNIVTLTANDGNGNIGTCQAVVTVEDFFTNLEIEVTAEDCNGGNGTISVSVNVPGGQVAYSVNGGVTWQMNGFFHNLSAGTYQVVVQAFGATGCTTAPVPVVVPSSGTPLTWYKDVDGDGYSDGVSMVSCASPGPEWYLAGDLIATSGDCNDYDANEYPGQTWYKDFDNDGWSDGILLVQCARPSGFKLAGELTATSGDCNDSNPNVNPGATEICNGIDDNCDGQIDEGVPGGLTWNGNVVFTTQTQVNAWLACYSVINGNLTIKNSGINNLMPLLNIVEVTGWVLIENTGLTSMAGLNSLTTVGGNLIIKTNPQLTTLNGLNAVTSVGGNLQVFFNLNLTDCCAIYALLNDPNGVGGSVAIYANKTGCDNVGQINAACASGNPIAAPTGNNGLGQVAAKESLQRVDVFPNPATERVTVQIRESFESGTVRFYDMQGRLLRQQVLGADSYQFSFDLGNLPHGTYLFHITVDGEQFTEKLVIE